MSVDTMPPAAAFDQTSQNAGSAAAGGLLYEDDEALDQQDQVAVAEPNVTFKAHHLPITDIQLAENGTILTASSDNSIKIWSQDDDDSYVLKKTLKKHSHVVSEIDLSADNSHFVSSSYDKTINLWDMNKLDSPNRFHAHTKAVLSVAMSQDGRAIVSGGADKQTIVWNVQGTFKIRTEAHKSFVNQVAFNPVFQNIFFSCSEDCGIIGYNLEQLHTKHAFHEYARIYSHRKPVLNFHQSPDGSLCAAITQTDVFYSDIVMSNFVAEEKLPTRQKISRDQSITATGSCLKFNPHAIVIAYTCGSSIYVNSLNKRERTVKNINDNITNDKERVNANFTKFVWSKDGQSLITGASDGVVRIIKCGDLNQQ